MKEVRSICVTIAKRIKNILKNRKKETCFRSGNWVFVLVSIKLHLYKQTSFIFLDLNNPSSTCTDLLLFCSRSTCLSRDKSLFYVLLPKIITVSNFFCHCLPSLQFLLLFYSEYLLFVCVYVDEVLLVYVLFLFWLLCVLKSNSSHKYANILYFFSFIIQATVSN